MITKELREASTEISVIFDNLSLDILNKIPKGLIDFFKNTASTTYTFEYDKTKTLNEQQLQPKTRGIIAFLYRDYICDNVKKQEYNEEYEKYIRKLEEQKADFVPDEIFESSKYKQDVNKTLVKVQSNDKWYTKIINWIKVKFRK